jgi:hypothetical protein
MRTAAIALALAVAASIGGCRGATTRAAIKSEASEPVRVTVVSPDGLQQVIFTDVAPGTTTTFEKLPFESFQGVEVQVSDGDARARLDLTPQGDNVVTVTKDNPENAPFW